MSTNDALAPVIERYVHALRSSGDGQYRVRSATFWLLLGLDRGSDADVAVVRQQFGEHGIDVSTPTGDFGREAPDAWIVLTAASTSPRRVESIDALPDSLFGDAPDSVASRPDARLTEPTPAAMTSTDAPPSATRLSQPPTTSATRTPSTSGTCGNGSSDAATWVTCPSCGAAVLLSALFCPLCDRPRTHVREQVRQRAASTGEAYPVLLDRVRREGWPLPDQRQPLNAAARAWIAIGMLVLAVGAQLDHLLALVLVMGGVVVLGVAVFKPESLDAVMGQGASRRSRTVAGEVVLRLATAMAFIVVTLLLWAGVVIFGMTRGTLLP